MKLSSKLANIVGKKKVFCGEIIKLVWACIRRKHLLLNANLSYF